jgi:SP family arabinose:H+ symporter-like MFS transporter
MNPSPPSSRITYICLTAAIGGLLFGFDTAVISGTISFVKAQFVLAASQEGWFVSSGLLGCILGVILTSFLSDRLGRKKVMILSGFMFLLSGIGCGFAPDFNLLVIARLIGGIGVGMASVISPMYIAEFAPATRAAARACRAPSPGVARARQCRSECCSSRSRSGRLFTTERSASFATSRIIRATK